MKQFNITKGIKGIIHLHNCFMRLKYSTDKTVKRKQMIIAFYKKYSLDATLEAFSISRSTLYSWMKRLKDHKNDPICLKNIKRPKMNAFIER